MRRFSFARIVGDSSKARIPRARLSLGSAWSADIYAVFARVEAFHVQSQGSNRHQHFAKRCEAL